LGNYVSVINFNDQFPVTQFCLDAYGHLVNYTRPNFNCGFADIQGGGPLAPLSGVPIAMMEDSLLQGLWASEFAPSSQIQDQKVHVVLGPCQINLVYGIVLPGDFQAIPAPTGPPPFQLK